MIIYTARNRFDTELLPQEISWEQLKEKLQTTTRTYENYAVYIELLKEVQTNIKDIGGFIGGELRLVDKTAPRNKESVLNRCLITLDLDNGVPGLLEQLPSLLPYKALFYTTHKHCPERPRARIIIPMTRTISVEEYGMVSTFLANKIGISFFDPVSFSPYQLMFYPSTSRDGEFIFQELSGPILNPDSILTKATANTPNPPAKPLATAEKPHPPAKPFLNPEAKPGQEGWFCSHYPISKAISCFLSNIYAPTKDGNRYKYIPADSSAGLTVTEDKLCYSFHSTDPACCNKLLNAYELVCLHKFGPVQTSHELMNNFVKQLQKEIAPPQALEASAWLKELERNQYGKIKPNTRNLLSIFANDPKLQGLAYDEFAQLFCCRQPIVNTKYIGYLTERQLTEIKIYIGEAYDIYRPNVVMDCLEHTCYAHAFNPIKDYLEKQTWDGTSRIATLLCDTLGAQDTPYVRAVTTKTLVAAIARIYEPGIKFDSMLVLQGPQGIGKSELLKRLSLGYHTEAVSFSKMKTKEAAELLKGNWFVELSELVGFNAADQDTVKNFLSTSADLYRAPYAEKPERHLRQCIIIGTTNNCYFLKDTTGNRRYWPVACTKTNDSTPFKLTPEYIGQLWAEALSLYKSGTVNLYLEGELLIKAEEIQRDNIVADDRQCRLQAYLDMPLPIDWYEWTIRERRKYLKAVLEDETHSAATTTFQRQFISLIEIRTEFLERDLKEKNPEDDKDIRLMMAKLPNWQWTEKRYRLKFYKQQRCFERIIA